MTRRIFICYEGSDRNQAKGFRLLRWNKNVDIEFFDRHLLDPVKSQNPEYIKSCIRERMRGTSVSVVLIGKHTKDSDWVRWEMEQTLANGKGLVGIYLPGCEGETPPKELVEAGAEILPWDPSKFSDAIERAAGGASYVSDSRSAPAPGATGCGRVAA